MLSTSGVDFGTTDFQTKQVSNIYDGSSSSRNNSRPSTSSSSSKQRYTSSSAGYSSDTLDCGQTVAETVISSNWSQVGAVIGDTRNSGMTLLTPWHCFFNPFVLFERCLNGDSRPRRDCFVSVECSSALLDSEYWPSWSYNEQFQGKQVEPTSEPNLFTPQLPFFRSSQVDDDDAIPKARDQCPPKKLMRLTPLTVDSRAASMIDSKNDGTMSSLNTLHRRADISVGFFTTETLDVIHSSNSDLAQLAGIPRSSDGNTPNDQKAAGIKRSLYKTPLVGRSRIDSESFRNTIGEVTCEKRSNSDDEVSPIESEAGFSTLLSAEGRQLTFSAQSKPSSANAVNKRLAYDAGSSQRHMSILTPNVNKSNGDNEMNLFGHFGAETSHQGDGASMIKTIQSLVHKAFVASPAHINAADCYEDKEKTPTKIRSTLKKDELSRQHLYLRKSVSFIKALRKSGRKGKCLIQGWVALQQEASWKEITRSPRRSDFRYIVLLDDMPLLHIFSSKFQQKKSKAKKELLEGCISVDLSCDIGIGAKLASKELGNEICVFNEDTGKLICGMLPVPMPSDLFLDKHRSRLAKREVLARAFCNDSSVEMSFKDANVRPIQRALTQSTDRHALIEQNDASRHLLFVLSAAITFPPPR